jgi:N-acetylglucosamine malate deacetylase 2
MIKISFPKYFIFSICFIYLFATSATAQHTEGPRVLIVIAHPDDESTFSATIYKITKEMHGTADIVCITNGEGGYKYSTLAEAYYGLELTDEKIGRENLPRIRKQELMNAGHILGIRNFFFLDQKDAHYSLDEHEPMDTSWDVPFVWRRLTQVMTKGQYDFVFCMLPAPGTHGGHKAATLMALRTAAELPFANKPIVLGISTRSKADTLRHFQQLGDYKETAVLYDTASFLFDRTVAFGYNKQLNYKIIVNWEIAEHRSQGTVQMEMNRGDYETFWYFAQNPIEGFEKARKLFEALKYIPYPTKTYK